MSGSMGLRQVKDSDGALLPYYEDANGRVYALKNAGQSDEYRCHVYARMNDTGKPIGVFEFPIESGRQTVSRSVQGEGGLSEDLYLSKVNRREDGTVWHAFRYATAADVIAARDHRKANEATASARTKASDPMHRDERLAKMLADAISTLAPQQQPSQRGAR